jgi:hypothetical protein
VIIIVEAAPSPGASWDLPDASVSNAVLAHVAVEKVVPFAATPQISFEVTGGTIDVSAARVSGAAFSFSPTSGTINAGWVGEDFVTASLFFIYPSSVVGAVTCFVGVEFLPHVKDR